VALPRRTVFGACCKRPVKVMQTADVDLPRFRAFSSYLSHLWIDCGWLFDLRF
jgi:hypothetical protein